eukprot:10037873-Lingulodinium_polyedra.AAC.1
MQNAPAASSMAALTARLAAARNPGAGAATELRLGGFLYLRAIAPLGGGRRNAGRRGDAFPCAISKQT